MTLQGVKLSNHFGSLLTALLLLATGLCCCRAEDINSFRRFGNDNPLSYQSVLAVAQDRDGFLWFGSQDGLHRFDGYDFKNYHHNSAEPNSLSAGSIATLLVDSQQQIWVGTRGGGLNLYREDSNDFLHIDVNTPALALTDNNINALLEDSRGNLWIATENGLNVLFHQPQAQTWQIKQIINDPANPQSLSSNSVEALVQTSDDHIWVGTNGGGINVFDLNGEFIKMIKPSLNGKEIANSHLISALTADREGNIWIGTFSSGLIKYDHLSNQFLSFVSSDSNEDSISSNTIEALYYDSTNHLWVATDKGLSIYNNRNKHFSRYKHQLNDPYSLANDVVLTIFEDHNKMIWIGTFSGLNYYDPNTTSFRQYNSRRYPQLKSNHISGFTQANSQSLYISTYNDGIYQLDLVEDQMHAIDLGHTFSDLSVTKLFADGDILWVGTRTSGLFQVNVVDKSIHHFSNDKQDPRSLSANSITDIITDHHGNLWVSTFHQGINRLNQDGSFTRFSQTTPMSDKGPNTNQILQLIADHQGYLWLGTYGGGVNRFDPATKRFIHLAKDDSNSASISGDIAWAMFQDDKNNLWVGTQGAGLNLLTKANMESQTFDFKKLSIKDGMNTLTVYAINQDSRGDIWFSSNKGFSRYSPKYQSFKHFDTTHGLLDLEYNLGVGYRTSDKTIYFGSPKGFNSINLENILDSHLAPQVRLTNILKLNEPMVFDKALSKLEHLEFTHNDQIISFEYVGLNYTDPNSTRYRYRLLGFDNQWIDAGKLKRATYTNLPAGEYSFQVIAGNNDNVWSDPGRIIAITILPAPWFTWWAYLLYTLLIALALLIYSRQINRKLLIEQQQRISLKQQVEDKTQEFQLKNVELEQANKQLENAATTDKVTGVKSRRYLDIYIEQASRLMAQIHENILPVQRSVLPRLYLLMVRIRDMQSVSNSQLINLTDLLLYTRNPDDLVIRWSFDTFAIIGYEKDKNARELANRLADRFGPIFASTSTVDMAYAFYPFNFEQPMALSWDQVSVLTEFGLKQVSEDPQLKWLGLHSPKIQPFNYLEVLKLQSLTELGQLVDLRQG